MLLAVLIHAQHLPCRPHTSFSLRHQEIPTPQLWNWVSVVRYHAVCRGFHEDPRPLQWFTLFLSCVGTTRKANLKEMFQQYISIRLNYRMSNQRLKNILAFSCNSLINHVLKLALLYLKSPYYTADAFGSNDILPWQGWILRLIKNGGISCVHLWIHLSCQVACWTWCYCN